MRPLILPILLLVLVSCVDNSNVLEPTPAPFWQNIDQGDGLNDNEVYKIFEDSEGDIWLGTGDGIMRYDGDDLDDFPEVSSQLGYVFAITEDEDGAIWAGSEFGLGFYEGGTWAFLDSISGFDLGVLSLFTDEDGRVWIGTTILGLLYYDNGYFQVFDFECNDCNFVNEIYQDSEENLWFGTVGGLKLLDGSSFELFTEADDLPHIDVRALEEDQWGRIWIGTRFGASVAVYDDGDIDAVSLQNGFTLNSVLTITEDRTGLIWIGIIGGGIATFDGAVMRGIADPDGPGTATIGAIMERSNGEIWVGSSEGIFVYGTNNQLLD